MKTRQLSVHYKKCLRGNSGLGTTKRAVSILKRPFLEVKTTINILMTMLLSRQATILFRYNYFKLAFRAICVVKCEDVCSALETVYIRFELPVYDGNI